MPEKENLINDLIEKVRIAEEQETPAEPIKFKKKDFVKSSYEEFYLTIIQARDFWMRQYDALEQQSLQVNLKMIEVRKNILVLHKSAQEEQEARNLGLSVEYLKDPSTGSVMTYISGRKHMGIIPDEREIQTKQREGA